MTRIKEMIQGADMIFVTAGMGGGTGTGAAPVIAQLAREEGCLTVGVVTKPFFFEGKQRARRAELGLAMLSEHVDTLITIPNQKLLTLGDEDLAFVEAFRKADEVLYQAIKGISDLITQNGIVNVDFADVKTVMSNMGRALMGTGCAKGQGRARLAAEMAVSSPLLDDISVEGATGVLINIVGGPDMRMREIEEAATLVQEQAHEDANIIFGATIDETMGEAIKVTVIATGFDQPVAEVPAAPQRLRRAPRVVAAPRARSLSSPSHGFRAPGAGPGPRAHLLGGPAAPPRRHAPRPARGGRVPHPPRRAAPAPRPLRPPAAATARPSSRRSTPSGTRPPSSAAVSDDPAERPRALRDHPAERPRAFRDHGPRQRPRAFRDDPSAPAALTAHCADLLSTRPAAG